MCVFAADSSCPLILSSCCTIPPQLRSGSMLACGSWAGWSSSRDVCTHVLLVCGVVPCLSITCLFVARLLRACLLLVLGIQSLACVNSLYDIFVWRRHTATIHRIPRASWRIRMDPCLDYIWAFMSLVSLGFPIELGNPVNAANTV